MMALKRLRGFILPLAILLIVILTVSGTAFMHHDYLERRMAMNNVDNQGAFYLANAGNERAREAFKIPVSQEWDLILAGTGVPANQVQCAAQALCPDLARGCAIPPFGSLVTASSVPNFPFDALFDAGQYEVRAFNNFSDPGVGTDDTDQQLTFAACGTVRDEEKLLEVTVLATTAGNLITCLVDPCPAKGPLNNLKPADCNLLPGNPVCDPMPGREPGVGPIPEPDHPLTDPQNYYRVEPGATPMSKVNANFKDSNNNPLLSTYDDIVGNADFDASNPLQDNTYYFVDGNVTLKNSPASDVVIFATGRIEVGSNVHLTNTVLVGVNEIEFKGGGAVGEIQAPTAPFLHYPAIFSGGDVIRSSGSFEIFGNIFAVGDVNLQALEIHGATFSQGPHGVIVQSASDTYTDDDSLRYYSLMKGFIYDKDDQTLTTIPGTWRELQ